MGNGFESPCTYVITDKDGNKLDVSLLSVIDGQGRRHPVASKRGRGPAGAKSWSRVNRMLKRGGRIVLELPGMPEMLLDYDRIDRDAKSDMYAPARFRVRDASGAWVDPTPVEKQVLEGAMLVETLRHTKVSASENGRHAAAVVDALISRTHRIGDGAGLPTMPSPTSMDRARARGSLMRSVRLDGAADRATVVREAMLALGVGTFRGDGIPDRGSVIAGDRAVLAAAGRYSYDHSLYVVEALSRGTITEKDAQEIADEVPFEANLRDWEGKPLIVSGGSFVVPEVAARYELDEINRRYARSVAGVRAARGRIGGPDYGSGGRDEALQDQSRFESMPSLPEMSDLARRIDGAPGTGARQRLRELLSEADAQVPGALLWAATQDASPALADFAVGMLPGTRDLRYVVEKRTRGSLAGSRAADLLDDPDRLSIESRIARVEAMQARIDRHPELLSNRPFMLSLGEEAASLSFHLNGAVDTVDVWAVDLVPGEVDAAAESRALRRLISGGKLLPEGAAADEEALRRFCAEAGAAAMAVVAPAPNPPADWMRADSAAPIVAMVMPKVTNHAYGDERYPGMRAARDDDAGGRALRRWASLEGGWSDAEKPFYGRYSLGSGPSGEPDSVHHAFRAVEKLTVAVDYLTGSGPVGDEQRTAAVAALVEVASGFDIADLDRMGEVPGASDDREMSSALLRGPQIFKQSNYHPSPGYSMSGRAVNGLGVNSLSDLGDLLPSGPDGSRAGGAALVAEARAKLDGYVLRASDSVAQAERAARLERAGLSV